jgi:hypothetical protein
MPSWSVLADFAKVVDPGVIKAGNNSMDALKGLSKGSESLKGSSLLLSKGSDLAKLGSGVGDAAKLGSGVGDAAKLGSGVGDAAKLGSGVGDAAKGADEAADAAKLSKAGDAAKGADEAADAAKIEKNAPPIKSKADAEASMTKWVKDNPGKAIAAGAGGTAAIVFAANKYMAVNGSKVGITKIEAHKDGGLGPFGGKDVAKITYSPGLDILMPDFLTITGTDCVPSIDGTDLAVYKVVSATEVWIKPVSKLTSGGTKGGITLKTTPTARLGEAVGAGVGAVAQAAGTAIEGAGGPVGAMLDGLLQTLGLPTGMAGYAIVACIVIVILVVLFKVVF